MNVLELFPCSGGLAEGLRRSGIVSTMAFDYDEDACDSYEQNLGHRPVQLDVRDLLRMIGAGWRPPAPVDLLVADPPCTPWSRAGKRLGQEDERDMMATTIEIIRALRPRAYLVANVPGLDDGPNLPVVQKTIGSLAQEGYCVADFARLDAADFGVPQHRIRPFWYGHLGGPCVTWPTRTHGSPEECAHPTLLGEPLRPWVTCRQALSHLSPEDLGSPVRLRWRGCKGSQVASVPDRPARVVGTSNLSDGNVLAHTTEAVRADRRKLREPGRKARASHVDSPADVVTTRSNGGGNVLFDGPNHRPSVADAPARTLTRNTHGDGALLVNWKHPVNVLDAPSSTLRGGGDGHSAPNVLLANDRHPVADADAPAPTIGARDRGGQGAQVLVVHERHPVSDHDDVARTITGGDGGGSKGARCMTWPWDAASTTVTADPNGRIGPPGHHGKSFLSSPNAVKLSEKAAAILQGFPDGWHFAGATKRARWAQIGMAMPPPLAEAVGRSILAAIQKGPVA